MIGFIGGGNMAEAVISGLFERGRKDVLVSDRRAERLSHLKKRFGVATTSDNREVLSSADVIVLAVKPHDMEEVAAQIGDLISQRHLIVSIAAGVRLSRLSELFGTGRLIRVMPNLPATVGEGMSVLSPAGGARKKDLDAAVKIFSSVGEVMILGEESMDVVTALSGSGPAFFAYYIEALAEAGVRMGLSASEALSLTLQTALGTVKMLKEGWSPEGLRKGVTSPGGTTAEGLYWLERNSLKAAVKEAVQAAAERAAELSRR